MLSRVRLIAIDIDGTLLDSQGLVSQANQDALRRAHEAGVETVICAADADFAAVMSGREICSRVVQYA